jgi:glycosyltransferase involved in cell wall biosynthesis
MRILWLTWKDRTHRSAGGAERLSSEVARRLAADGHEVKVVTSAVPGRPARETLDGYEVIRAGNRFTVYPRALWFVARQLGGWPELVIEEVNTVPFFSRLVTRAARQRFVLFYQLCREIWFLQLPRAIGAVGYVIEPLYLRLLAGDRALAMSESTRQDLVRHGFPAERVAVTGAAISLQPVERLEAVVKAPAPMVVSLGSVRPMKRTLDQVRAFELAKHQVPELRLLIAGETDSEYGRQVLEVIRSSPFHEDIKYLGRIDEARKRELLERAHVILVSSVKEGWGLIVTEAASQGTPAVVYDVDGLRDSVRDGETGLVVPPRPEALADGLVGLLHDPTLYASLQRAGWEWSRTLTFEALYERFLAVTLGARDS